MSPSIAQALFLGLIAWLLFRDLKRRPAVSYATWIVLLWSVIFASRPVSTWFQVGFTSTSPDEYLEGSPTDRAVFLILILMGCAVLLRRRAPVVAFVRQNAWLFLFFIYCLVSATWSDFPFVAFKRWFKDFGNIVMVLILLTEREPTESIKATFVRCAYLLVPISVLWIRYFPDMGRRYSGYSQNDLMYIGVATHKNTLGALLLVSSIFLVWDLTHSWRSESGPGPRAPWIDNAIVLAMSFWLLLIANSATSLVCTVIGVSVFLITGMGVVNRRLAYVEAYAIGITILWVALDSTFQISESVVLSLGRDMTLTSRTGAWEFVLSPVVSSGINPLLGAGFKSFWAGERMERLWVELPGIVQSHNGYLETYLNGGLIGVLLLFAMLTAGFRKIKRQLSTGSDTSRLRLAVWVVALVYNYSEASFSSLSLLWLATLLVVIDWALTSGPLTGSQIAARVGQGPYGTYPRPFTPSLRRL